MSFLPQLFFSLPMTLPGHLREAQLPITIHVKHPQLWGYQQYPVTHQLLLPCTPPTWGAETPGGDTEPQVPLTMVCVYSCSLGSS